MIDEIKQRIKTAEDINALISHLIKFSMLGHEEISSLANLLNALVDEAWLEEVDFKKVLLEILNEEFDSSNNKETLDDSKLNHLACLIILIGQLYCKGLLDDPELATWLLHSHLEKLPSSQLSYFSSFIGPKIRNQTSKHIHLLITRLGNFVEGNVANIANEIKEDLKDLESTFIELTK